MIRIVVFLLALAAVAFATAWVADRPGEISVVWMDTRIETSVMVAGLAFIVVVIAAIVLWSIVRAAMRSPEQVSLFFRHRRAVRGYLAISRGLIAIGSGDAALARRSADDAARLSPGDPLALLLAAQSAQLSGDRVGAEKAFRAMLGKPETKQLGLRGLYVEAQRRNDAAAARAFAEEAIASGLVSSWAGQAVLDYRSAAADWSGALAALDAMKSGLEKSDYRRKRAVLLTARALAEQDRDRALTDVLDAVKLAPDLVPAAAYAGRRLAEAGNARKARKILEAAWSAHQHPDIAAAYANVRPGDSARERFNRIRKLAEKAPAGLETALALSCAALDAKDFKAARAALKTYLPAPTGRVASLMADIEQGETGDIGRAREWMARAMRAVPDPVWTADGAVSDKWLPVSPVTGVLDAFQWKVPLAEIGIERPIIEEAVRSPLAAPVAIKPVPAEPAPDPAPRMRGSRKPEVKPAVKEPVEVVIPLVHAPDDPGPDSPLEPDPVSETPPPPAAWPQTWQKTWQKTRQGSWQQSWQKIRQLFR